MQCSQVKLMTLYSHANYLFEQLCSNDDGNSLSATKALTLKVDNYNSNNTECAKMSQLLVITTSAVSF